VDEGFEPSDSRLSGVTKILLHPNKAVVRLKTPIGPDESLAEVQPRLKK
jgi:hypothetical protein